MPDRNQPGFSEVASRIRERSETELGVALPQPARPTEYKLRQYEKALEDAEEMIAIFDRDYRIVVANTAFVNYRESKEPLAGRLLSEILREGLFEKVVKERIDECFRGKIVEFELKYAYPERGEREWSASCFPIQVGAGVERVACILHDITDHNRMRQMLEEREQRERMHAEELRAIIEALPIPVLIAQNAECTEITANAAGYELLAVAKSVNLSKTVPPDRQPNFRMEKDGVELHPEELPMRQAIATRKPILGIERSIIAADGSSHHVIISAAPLLGENGEPYGGVSAMLDVTEKNRLDRALKESEERFYKAFKKSPMALSITSARDHRFIEINDTYERLTGYSRDEVHGLTPFDLNIWVNPEERVEVVRRALELGSLRDIEVEYRTKDGKVRTGAASAELIEIGGEPCLLGVIADITDLKRAQATAVREKGFTDALFDAGHGLIFVVDEEGNLVRGNRRAQELTDFKSGSLLTAERDSTFLEENRRAVFQKLRAVFQKEHVEFEVGLKTPDGTTVPFYFTGSGIQIAGQRYAIGIAIDASARKQAEREIQKLSRQLISTHEEERSYLARELHDDTSQKLALVAIQLEELSRDVPRRRVEVSSALLELHERVSAIASDIHALSRRLHPSVLDRVGPVAAIRSLCEQVRRRGAIKVTFNGEITADALTAEEALCLYRVAEEAINNAVKHSGTAEIRVEVAQDTVGITLRVSDSGKGFDPHRDYDGLGLLSIKERLRSVSGTISIVSHDGQGTCLEAVIPFLKSEIASD